MQFFGSSVNKSQWTQVMTVLWLVFLSLISMGEGFKQKLWLYLEGGNALYFDTNIGDLSEYHLLLPKVTRICVKGIWSIYKDVNYEHHQKSWGYPHNSELNCFDNVNVGKVKSLRHMAASDASTDSISLYSGSNFSGNERLVGIQARTGIKTRINSFSITGNSEWMLFEGQNLDGKYVCYPVSYHSEFYFKNGHVSDLNLDTIGSVFRGCDLNKIQHYKRHHKTFFLSKKHH